MFEAPHELELSALLERLGTAARKGLSRAELDSLRARHGFNELTREPPVPLWKRLLRHYNDLVIWILLAAAILTAFMGDWIDTSVILAVVLLNGFLGFFQEDRAEREFAALEKLAAPMAKVIRDGMPLSVAARELLPGDEIVLEEGDFVPADARLLEAQELHAQESALTGESLPVVKRALSSLKADTPLGDRRNMIYAGTSLTSGRGRAVVVHIGMDTELGRIARLLRSATVEPTPLQRRISQLGRFLVLLCLGLIAVTFLVQILRGGAILEAFLLSVSLAVAAVPEGLPAVVTIALAAGLARMAKKKALIRRLPSVETLGSVSVICSDKTGTLTRNEMTARWIFAGGRTFEVTGSGYEPVGGFLERDGPGQKPVQASAQPDLWKVLHIAARCNHARLIAPEPEKGLSWRIFGDPTDGSLLVAALKGGMELAAPQEKILREIPFESHRKSMTVVLQPEGQSVELYTKGATEAILPRCTKELHLETVRPMTEARRLELEEVNRTHSSRGFRVLALAYRELSGPEDLAESELIFAGFAALFDPPREEVRLAVAKCRAAGIRPVVITGDHPATALAIARDLGIATMEDRAMLGDDFSRLSPEEQTATLPRIAVFARVSPEHKLKIVRAWKSLGHVVAMTGDGVNDAPAVKEADIGIAMGISGTDVTKAASDLVLLDDNFATIVAAVEEGRSILANIQKVLHYLLAGNSGELLVMFVAALVGLPNPLLATQLLWINLVTDGFPALALGQEPVEPGIMNHKPRSVEEPILSKKRSLQILWHGSLIAACVLVVFHLVYGGQTAKLAEARAAAFCTLAFAHVLFSLNCRSDKRLIFQLGALSNVRLFAGVVFSLVAQVAVMTEPHLRQWFGITDALTPSSWNWVLLFAAVPFVGIELSKLFLRGHKAGK